MEGNISEQLLLGQAREILSSISAIAMKHKFPLDMDTDDADAVAEVMMARVALINLSMNTPSVPDTLIGENNVRLASQELTEDEKNAEMFYQGFLKMVTSAVNKN